MDSYTVPFHDQPERSAPYEVRDLDTGERDKFHFEMKAYAHAAVLRALGHGYELWWGSVPLEWSLGVLGPESELPPAELRPAA